MQRTFGCTIKTANSNDFDNYQKQKGLAELAQKTRIRLNVSVNVNVNVQSIYFVE